MDLLLDEQVERLDVQARHLPEVRPVAQVESALRQRRVEPAGVDLAERLVRAGRLDDLDGDRSPRGLAAEGLGDPVSLARRPTGRQPQADRAAPSARGARSTPPGPAPPGPAARTPRRASSVAGTLAPSRVDPRGRAGARWAGSILPAPVYSAEGSRHQKEACVFIKSSLSREGEVPVKQTRADQNESDETTSPPWRVARAWKIVKPTCSLMKRTLPSAKRKLAPPGWRDQYWSPWAWPEGELGPCALAGVREHQGPAALGIESPPRPEARRGARPRW